MHMKQLKMLFQVIQISSLNKVVLNSYNVSIYNLSANACFILNLG